MNRQQRRAAAKLGNPDTLCALAAILEKEGKTNQAVMRYRQALAIRPGDQHTHNDLGLLLHRHGRHQEATLHYRKAIEFEPGECKYYSNLGNVVAKIGRLDEAINLYRQAIALQPNFSPAHNGLGLALFRLGQVDEAIACYMRALDCDPNNREARINLGLAYADKDQIVEALDQAEIVSRSSEEASFPHYVFGILLARCGATEAARLCLNTYLERNPQDGDGARLLLASLGDGAIPERASPDHLDRLYAARAANWDLGVAGATGYRGAGLVASMLHRLTGKTEGLDIIDAGCGTGLVGSVIANKARRLVGVDTSSHMLEKAKEKGVYHQLHQDDLVEVLKRHVESFDVVTCAATLIHFGDLHPVFEAAAISLRDHGLFIFTLFPNEEDDDKVAVGTLDGYAEGGCYRHGRNYVAQVAEATGFAVEMLELDVHEYVQRKPKMGLVGAVRRVSLS